MENNRLAEVKKTIEHWNERGIYYREFEDFFLKWTLLNLYYNEFSNKKNEVDRVLEFGKKHEHLFEQLKNNAVELVSIECVGRARGLEIPDEWVKTATIQLRSILGIDTQTICKNCRGEKRARCQQVTTINYEFVHMEALMRILYQVRCNMFHGEKTDREEFQVERNQLLVREGNRVIAVVLKSLIEN